jgi:hypothetical protein
MSKPKVAPGVLRLRAAEADAARLRAGRRVLSVIVAPPQLAVPKRKPKPPAPGQAALF